MRALSSLPLDDDIIDRFLTFLPDFPSLGATITSSKHFYAVFKLHPNSIIRAVAYNIAGPALPQAMRVLRHTPHDDDESQDSSVVTPQWVETDPVSPMSSQEMKDLASNAAVVKALEDLFSSRHKDRTSPVSQLDSMESWKFRRAMYRMMLFSRIFPLEEPEWDEDEDERIQALQKITLKKKRFLTEFPNFELFPLHSVAIFLVEVAKWAETAEISYSAIGFGGAALSCGPAAILEAYQTQSRGDIMSVLNNFNSEDTEETLDGYLTDALSKIWESRKTKPPPSDPSHWKSILDDIRGQNEICHRCSAIYGFDLWNESNWGYLRGNRVVSIHTYRSWLKGNLGSNSMIDTFLRQQLYEQGFSYTIFLQEIHDVRTTMYHDWDKQDWLCASCIREIIQTHINLWLLERLKKAGNPIHEDCWYGYNCRTQTHSMHHATRLNHLCEPAR